MHKAINGIKKPVFIKDSLLRSSRRIYVKQQKRELNRHTWLEGRRKLEDKDVGNRSSRLA